MDQIGWINRLPDCHMLIYHPPKAQLILQSHPAKGYRLIHPGTAPISLWAFLLQPALSSEVAQETREVGQSVQSVLGSGFETPRTRTTGRLHSVHCQGSRSNTKSCCSSSH